MVEALEGWREVVAAKAYDVASWASSGIDMAEGFYLVSQSSSCWSKCLVQSCEANCMNVYFLCQFQAGTGDTGVVSTFVTLGVGYGVIASLASIW